MAIKNGEKATWVPPYISFNTLTGLLKRLETDGVPPRIDRSYLDTFSGGYQSQVLAALKALRLIDDDGVVQPILVNLAENSDQRTSIIAGLVRSFYPEP